MTPEDYLGVIIVGSRKPDTIPFFLIMMIAQLLLLTSTLGLLEARLGLFEVTPVTDKEVKDLIRLANELNLDLWKQPTLGQPTRFSAKSDAEHINYLRRQLASQSLSLRIVNGNLDETINKELKDNAIRRSKSLFRSMGGGGIHTYFAAHKEVNDWLKSLSDQNPNIISFVDIGRSYKGKVLRVLKISTGPNKKIIFLEGGIHAREWLGISSVIWILNKIVVGFKNNDSDVMTILDRFDIYALPIMNPDGYELSRRGGEYRLWRKNVMPVGKNCFGVDLNRNFDIDFGKSSADPDPCHILYPGPRPFSAPETRNLKNFILSIKDRIKLYIAFHAYSQMILTPWGYTKSSSSDNEEIMRVAHLMSDSIFKTSGKQYTPGSPANILYAASGLSFDWIKKIGVKYVYTFEVRPDKYDPAGFIAPVSWIAPTGEEMYNAVMLAAKSVV